MTDFRKILTGRFLENMKYFLLKIQPSIAYVARLLREALMSENKRLTINYKVV